METFIKALVLACVAFALLEKSQAATGTVSPTTSSSVNITTATPSTPSTNLTTPSVNSTTVTSTANQTTAGNITMTTHNAGPAPLSRTCSGLALTLLILILLTV